MNPDTNPALANDAMEILSQIPFPGAISPPAPAAPDAAPGQPAAPAVPAPATPPPSAPVPPAPPAPQPQVPGFDFSALGSRFDSGARVPAPEAIEAPEALPADQQGKIDPTKAGHAFATLRAENARLKRELIPGLETKAAEAEARAKAAEEKAAALLEENTKAKTRVTELDEQVGRLSLTESQAFKAKYGSREAGIRGKLEKALTEYGRFDPARAQAKAAELLDAASKGPDALSRSVEDLHPAIAGAAMFAAQEFAALEQERTLEISEWRQTVAANGVESAKAEVVRGAEERRRLAGTALDQMRASGAMVYVIDDADPEAPAKAAALEAAFHGFMQQASPEKLAAAAAEGYVAPVLYAKINEQAQMINELQSMLAGFRYAAGIPVGVTPSVTPPPAPVAPLPNVVPAEAADDPMVFARASLTGLAQRQGLSSPR